MHCRDAEHRGGVLGETAPREGRDRREIRQRQPLLDTDQELDRIGAARDRPG
jgi:hypothetical protein